MVAGVVIAQEKFAGGIVYGPRAAFNISAPEGWVLDNESGKEQGLPCVLYPKGESWVDAKTVMYAQIASGKTKDGHDYFINEYPATKNYSQWERVGYVQLPHAVAYIVLSSLDKANYQKDSGALAAMLKSTFIYLEPKQQNANH
jgi:hypothetical protein